MRKRVLLGMSGGVDSSVSAVILQKQGYDVIGCTMKLWDPCDEKEESSCCGSNEILDAKRVCDKLGIPHYTINCKEEFKLRVIDDFVNAYKEAKTPNPCIECNKYLKFGVFYKKAKELECEYIATGHYAKCEYSKEYGQMVLKMSDAEKKDQSYFLYSISKDVLPHILFPLSNFKDKEQVRQFARENGLAVASKSDSQEICFITDNDYASFVCKNCDKCARSGNICKIENGKKEIIGTHNGLINYTIGQRKGLGIAYKEPLYVIDLDKKENEVIVGIQEELYKTKLYAEDLNFLLDINLDSPIEVLAKIRYRASRAKAILTLLDNNKAQIIFEEPQRAITPGQSVVFYLNDIVLGGGKIKNKFLQ